jgi:hypothetical protein
MIITTLAAAFSKETTVQEAWASKSWDQIALATGLEIGTAVSCCFGGGVVIAARVVGVVASVAYDSYLTSQTFDALMVRLRSDANEEIASLKEKIDAKHKEIRDLTRAGEEKDNDNQTLSNKCIVLEVENATLKEALDISETDRVKLKRSDAKKGARLAKVESADAKKSKIMESLKETIVALEAQVKLKEAIINREDVSLLKPILALDTSAVINLANECKLIEFAETLSLKHKLIMPRTVFNETKGEAGIVLKELIQRGLIEVFADAETVSRFNDAAAVKKYGTHRKDISIEESVANYGELPFTLITDDHYMGGWATKITVKKKQCKYGELHEHMAILSSAQALAIHAKKNK